MEEKKYELVRFKNNEVELEVSLNPLFKNKCTDASNISFRRFACSSSVNGIPFGMILLL